LYRARELTAQGDFLILLNSSWTIRLLKKANPFSQKQETNEYSLTLTSQRVAQNAQIYFKIIRTAYTSKRSLVEDIPLCLSIILK
jgi:hypothetical protein